MNEKKQSEEDQSQMGKGPQPEPETLHKTDPQKNMDGPVSTTMDKIGEAFNTSKSKDRADQERDKNM